MSTLQGISSGHGVSRIELLRAIVDGNQAQRIRIDGKKVYVDHFTASAVVQIYDALNEANRAKFIALPWPKMISITWKLVQKYQASGNG